MHEESNDNGGRPGNAHKAVDKDGMLIEVVLHKCQSLSNVLGNVEIGLVVGWQIVMIRHQLFRILQSCLD